MPALLCVIAAVALLGWARSAQAATPIEFGSITDYPVHSAPAAVAVGQLTNDGRSDVVTANPATHDISVLFAEPNGNLAPPINLPLNSAFGQLPEPTAVTIGDVNGDGKNDIITAGVRGAIQVFLNEGNGSFSAPIESGIQTGPNDIHSIAMGDFNHDGKIDIAVADGSTGGTGAGTVSIFLGSGDGKFTEVTPVSPVSNKSYSDVESIRAAEFTPGFLGIVTLTREFEGCTTLGGGEVGIFLSNIDGSLSGADTIQEPCTTAMSVADTNGDHLPDIVTVDSATLRTYLGTSTLGCCTFAPAVLSPLPGGYYTSLTLPDLNGDGTPDAAIGDSSGVTVVTGNGDGTFSGAQHFDTSHGAVGVTYGDFNGDGKLDLVTANIQVENEPTATVSVLLQSAPKPPPPPGYVPPQVITGPAISSFTNGFQNVGQATLAGTIIPGTISPLKYHFVYTIGALHLSTPDTVYSGAPVSAPTAPLLPPYVRNYYQLVATDGKQTVQGALRSFYVENQLNPTGFDMTSAPNGPGKYNVTIDCNSASCPPFSGTSAQLAQGELEVEHYSHATGAFDGKAGLSTVGHLGSRTQNGISDAYRIEFSVDGTVQLSEVALSFNQPSGSFLGPFSLTGRVAYNCTGGAPGCFPDMEGYLGAGDGWTICYQNQRSCVPPTSAVKSGAHVLAAASAGLALVPTPVSDGLAALGFVFDLIGLDPPDSHFTRITRPAHPRQIVIVGHGLGRRAARVVKEMVGESTDAGATGAALLDAVQRFQGATAASNDKWIRLQAQAAIEYGHQLAFQCRRLAALLEADHRVLAGSPLGRLHASSREIERALRSARRRGLGRSLTRELESLGIDAATVRRLGRVLPRKAPHGVRTLLGQILAPNFAANLRALADALDRYAAGLAQGFH